MAKPKTSLAGSDRTKSPCIGVCSTSVGDKVCRGCKRFSHEVINWNSYSEQERDIINARLIMFQNKTLQYWLRVVDLPTLGRVAETHRVMLKQRGNDALNLAYRLLQQASDRIRDMGEMGCAARLPELNKDLPALLERIEDQLYQLSEVHYKRYFSQLVID